MSGGPVRLDVPDSGGRYDVLQFVDAWTNNFAYIGHRATGTGPGSFLLTRAGDGRTTGDSTPMIHFPTPVASIVGRWAVNGPDDLPSVRALQDGLTLTPTSDEAAAGVPEPNPGVADDIMFFERMRTWMQAFPAARRDLLYQARFEPLGLLAPESPYVDACEAFLGDLRHGLAQGREVLERSLCDASSSKQNGWNLTYHVFDYNTWSAYRRSRVVDDLPAIRTAGGARGEAQLAADAGWAFPAHPAHV